MTRIMKINEMVNEKNKFTIELQVDDWHLAESLYDIAERIENEDLLDGLYEDNPRNLETTVNGDHYTATIRIN